MDKYEEQAAVRAFLSTKSERHFRLLYRQYTNKLYRLAFRLLNGDVSAAEDAIQETWIRAVQGLASFKWQSSLSTWLCGITINCCKEIERKNRLIFEQDIDTTIPSVSDDKIDIQTAINRLPAGYREIFVLYDMEGYKHQEIATMLGINEGTSKSQLFNARRAMQKMMTDPQKMSNG